jgi:Lrp/AsnC family transcriptional regulator
MLDETDRRILRSLLSDPDAPPAELSDRAGVTQATWVRRIERMTRAGAIRGQHAVPGWAELGYAVTVSLRVTLDKADPGAFDRFLAAAREVPEVTEIQTFLGRVDVRLAVLARDMEDYRRVYHDRILTLPHIADIEALLDVSRVTTRQVPPI